MSSFFEKLASFSIQSALMVALLVTGVYYLILFDDGSEIDAVMGKLKVQLVEQQKSEAESDLALAEIEQVRASFGALSEQFKIVSAQLPTTIEQSDILNTIDQLSKQSGVGVKTKEWRDARRDGSVIETLPMRIVAEATYPELYAFVGRISELERLLSIGNLTIAGPRSARQGNKSSIEMELRVHRYIGDPASSGEVKR